MTDLFKNITVVQRPMPVLDEEAHNYKPSVAPGASRVLKAGSIVADGHRPLYEDILLEEDVRIPMRDGVVIYADVFRPANSSEVCPAIIMGGPFGKNGGPNKRNFNKWPWRFGCPKIATTGLEKFEGLDPGYWCMHGYAIVHTDCRGTWKSTGNVTMPCKKEGEDNYDIIEFLAAQPWCNGKVSMAGNSYLSMTQWFAGAENPPHLACLAPWEGVSDLYNDTLRRGGSPNPGFTGGTFRGDTASATGSTAEDLVAMCYEYPLWNDYWDSHRARLDQIKCPLYIVASWTNQLHTYGTFRGWQQCSSREKWLRVHNNHEWPDLYDTQSVEDLRKFFDCYLKDMNNDWKFTPKVRLSVLVPGGRDIVNRPESSFPLARQKELKLFLDAKTMTMSQNPTEEVTIFSHDAITGKSVFSVSFPTATELVGYIKLRLWGEADGSDDMDIFVQLQKFNSKTGKPLETLMTDVGRLQSNPDKVRDELLRKHEDDPSYAESFFDTGPLGCIRASHRELDQDNSTPLDPIYTHSKEQLLSPGEVVCLDIGIWPYGWIIRPNDELRLTVSGFNPKPHLRALDEKPRLKNKGKHVFHTGGDYESFLLLPLIPSRDE